MRDTAFDFTQNLPRIQADSAGTPARRIREDMPCGGVADQRKPDLLHPCRAIGGASRMNRLITICTLSFSFGRQTYHEYDAWDDDFDDMFDLDHDWDDTWDWDD